MKYLYVLLFILCSCKSTTYTQAPTLAEKQEMYHKSTKKPLKKKLASKLFFWYPTIFVMSFMYVSTIKK